MNQLALTTGIDIPFPEAGVNIHQPTINEISFLGEEAFYKACNLLTITKEDLKMSDKINLSNQTNFDILMAIITDENNPTAVEQKIFVEMLLTIIFPSCSIKITKNGILLIQQGDKELHQISANNFDLFSEKIKELFCLKQKENDELNYKPANDRASAIAEKLKKAREKIAAEKGQTIGKLDILSRYVSILSVALKIDINTVKNYTVWQLFDQYERFSLHEANDLYIKEMLAGASGVETPDAWTKDIH